MSLFHEERASDSPLVEAVTRGWTEGDGSTIRPAECRWHMVFTKYNGRIYPLVVGPWTSAGEVSWTAGAEILWIRFKLGVFMPHLTTRKLLNSETVLAKAADRSFWLYSSTWQIPNYDNVDTFVNRLIREEVLVCDPVVSGALEDQLQPQAMSSRTVRHRFLHATGLTQSHIRQMKRAQHAAALLRQGKSILDTVYEAGYFDQPHLTRSLKQFIGHTPAELIRLSQPVCHSVQDSDSDLDDDTSVLATIR